MWVPLGNIWVILGDKKQAHLPAVRPFTHHICPHSTVLPSKPANGICHPAPCSAQVVQNWCRLIIYSQTMRELVLKFPFLAPFFVQCVKYNIQYISFLLFSRTVMTKSITLGEEGVQGWVWMWAAFVTFLCKSEPQDIMNRMTSAPMCVIRQEPPSCIQNTSDTSLAIECNSATVSLPLLHFSFSTDDPIVIMFCCICDYVQSNRFALWKKGFSEVLFYWPDYHCMYHHRVRIGVNYQRRLKLGLTTDHEH